MKHNKKKAAVEINYIAIFVIALIALALIIFFVFKYTGKAGDSVGDTLKCSGTCISLTEKNNCKGPCTDVEGVNDKCCCMGILTGDVKGSKC